jgi:hypothetical protein
MRYLFTACLLTGCAVPSSDDDEALLGPRGTRRDTYVPVDATCTPAPEFSLLAADPSASGRSPFAGNVPLEFVSAPVSRFWAAALPSDTWAATLAVRADGYGVPIFEAIGWDRVLGEALGAAVTWPTDLGPLASRIDLCSATFSLAVTLTELDAGGVLKNDGACVTTVTTPFRLEPDAAATSLCPLFLPSEETLQRLREMQQQQMATLTAQLNAP